MKKYTGRRFAQLIRVGCTICFAGILGAGIVNLVGCAKDEDSVDYHNKQFSNQLALMQAANGQYTGVALARDGGSLPKGSPLAALRMTLEAQGQVSNAPSSDSTPVTNTPTLVSTIDLQGSSLISVNGQTAAYDPGTGFLQIDIPVKQANTTGLPSSGSSTSSSSSNSASNSATDANTSVLSIIGHLTPQKEFVGIIQVRGYQQYGATIDLKTSGDSLGDIAKTVKTFDPFQGIRKGFEGTTTFKGGTTKPMRLVLQQPNTSPEQAFIDIFRPIKSVLISFDYGGNARIPYSNGYWYQNDGVLTGFATLTESVATGAQSSDSSASVPTTSTSYTLQLSVSCKEDPATGGFNCDQTTQSDSSPVAKTTVAPVHGQSSPPPPDDTADRDTAYARFVGAGQLDKNVTTKINLLATYPARDRLTQIFNLMNPDLERILQFTLLIDDGSGTSVTFTQVKWDVLNGTIDGNETDSLNGISVVRQISCQNFTMDVTKAYNIPCLYRVSTRDYDIHIAFKGEGKGSENGNGAGSHPAPPKGSSHPKPKK